MKFNTKVSVGEKVITPISDRIASIWAIKLIGNSAGAIRYEVVLELPKKDEAKFKQYYIYFDEEDLRSV